MTRKTSTPPARARREIIDVDPSQLEVDDQVRGDATPDEGLIESVRELGIIQPPTVYLDEDRNSYVIVTGHRRVGAAILAGLTSIEVIVGSRDDVADAHRVQRQLVENQRREAITPLDEARGYATQQLLFGLTPAEIAHQVGEKPDRVRAALKAVDSEAGSVALEAGVDLAQAAVIAEFEETDPDTASNLLDIAQNHPAEFGRATARAENNRKAQARQDDLEQQLETERVRLVARISYAAIYWNDEGGRALSVLEIDPSAHADCAGHAAVIENKYAIDEMRIAYVCTDPKLHTKADPDAQERKEKADAWLKERSEQEAARVQLTADLHANSTARREWLRGFLTGRLNQTPGIFDLIADMHIGAVVLDDYETSEVPIAVELLTGTRPTNSDGYALANMIKRGEVTPLRALAAHALAVAEYFADSTGMPAPRTLAAYYRRLQIWGYPLTELDTTRLEQARTALAEDEADSTDTEEGAA